MEHELYTDLEKILDAVFGTPDIVDGVYMDVVAGVPGTAWPIGLPGNPVNNLADAITIMAARDIWRLVLSGARDFVGTYTPVVVNPTVMTDANIFPMKPNSLVGLTVRNVTDGSSGVILSNTAQSITAILAGGATNQWNPGDAWNLTTYPYAVTFNKDMMLKCEGDGYDITVASPYVVDFLGDLSCESITGVGSSEITVEGNCTLQETALINDGFLHVLGDFSGGTIVGMAGSGNIEVAGAGAVVVGGDCVTGSLLTDAPVGIIIVRGNCRTQDRIENVNTGTIEVYGDCIVETFIKNDAGGTLIFFGNLVVGNEGHIPVAIDNGIGTLIVHLNCECKGDLTNPSGTVEVDGDYITTDYLNNTSGGVAIRGSFRSGGGLSMTGAGAVVIGGDFSAEDGIDNTTGTIIIQGDCSLGVDLLHTDAGTIIIRGNTSVGKDLSNASGIINFYGDCSVKGDFANATGIVDVGGDCSTGAAITNATGSVIIAGNVNDKAEISQTDAGLMAVYGNCSVSFANVAVGGSLEIRGSLDAMSFPTTVDGALTVHGESNLFSITNTGTATFIGIAHIYGAITNTGTLTYHGVYPEVAVNTTAINAGETDVLNLALTAGFHWTVDDLVLKSADPGANKVYVKLNKLVNGVLTTINLTTADPNGFEINNLNFNQYWSLNDMFGRDILAGDNIQITVKASAGGPYAVTGSYAHHSD